ncbi:MAG: phosphoserine phosphatase [Thermoplasmata archaeon HGW-Thermoplasmata-1]|nr:MAG: phosphoserine phosphatase [Thermoplasmata archaeon HGW-Thermoplasmata-1]
MTEDVRSLEKEKDVLQKKANDYRTARDKLNEDAKKWVKKRDELNNKVRELIEKANEHKKKRDELNEQVCRSKVIRDEMNAKYEEIAKVSAQAKKKHMPAGAPSVSKLKKEFKALEFEQMTTPLSPKKEKALIDRLSALQAEIKGLEKTIDDDPELKEAISEAKLAKERAEKQHKHVGELADGAQKEHESMIGLFNEAGKLRKDADSVQEKFVVAKLEADKVHNEYIALVNRIHEIEKELAESRPSEKGSRRSAGAPEVLARADEIFDQFKNGKKLSTEDLMILQKAGLL